MAPIQEGGIRIAIDRGGTFTDCVGNPGTGKMKDDIVIKLLSEDPSNYDDAPLEGIRRLLSKFTGRDIPRGEALDTSKIESIRMGTTVATNALLERKGEKIAMVVTKGFKDCLEIGNQSRPRIFDLAIKKPDVLYEEVIEVDERVTLEDYAEDPFRNQTKTPPRDQTPDDAAVVRGLSGEAVRILRRPEEERIKSQLQALYSKGVRSIAVCLMHGYTFPDHEALVGRIARELGFNHVSLSHELMPMIKLVPRATSACADAYLTPAIKKYIAGFEAGFEGGLGTHSLKTEEGAKGARCEFMQSDGGLVDVDQFSGLKAILSGPAGGVVGYALTSYDPATRTPVIGFDMGGTSTDVSRYGAGRYEHVFETTTAGVTIQSPQLDINTVAAGGGSRLFFRNGLFVVGPESAGAHPGPACYRKGGPLAVTDANLFLGRLLPDFFPKIFGKHENEGLDKDASEKLFKELTDQINEEVSGGRDDKKMTCDEVAYGFIKIANETMTRPIRSLTEAKGHDTSQHRLATFGGAGGQHAVAIAENLGIRQILVHRYSSVLSAYGMGLADVVDEQQVPSSKVWSDDSTVREDLKEVMDGLKGKAVKALHDQGFNDDKIVFEEYLNMRYRGTESALMIIKPSVEEVENEYNGDEWAFERAFIKQHQQEFGFTLPGRDIIVDDVRARGIGQSFKGLEKTVDQQLKEIKINDLGPNEKRYGTNSVYFEGGRQETPIFKLDDLNVGDRIKGPAIIADGTQTIVVTPIASALVIDTHVVINIGDDNVQTKKVNAKDVDPIMLSIFANRFMAIAEQMGRALQKTSVSTNVKERLDYSCALFDADGGLVANAPHLPVHLGSMSTCVRTQSKLWEGKLKPGDVLVSNHPEYGGTHLPDITVITPAFNDGKIVFYVASRAHHADIGGILPGSMPPHSRELFQEGAAIKSEKLVSEGNFNEERITELLQKEPSKYPGCSGTRCLADNLNDLKAQIAANQKGINLISALIEDYGEEVVQFYMHNIQNNAELSVRNLLKQVSKRFEGKDLSAVDYMDDGSPIRLKISIDADKGEAVFDFAGTGPEVYGNINAPRAVTYSAIIYCLRCLISEDIPLNQGCMKPIDVRIPPKSFLSPSSRAAVVGGNVLTSQRLTDVILKCFQACAASQGDCNNLTFGIGGSQDGEEEVKGFGYYETIAGGSGAGPDWDGSHGVHTHMTNTRITDSEVFERRYPVILREFSLRPCSGGIGQHPGGDGVIRDIEFRIPVHVSILSERRVYHPYGLNGGGDAECGLNLWIRRVAQSDTDHRGGEDHEETRIINMGAKNTAFMQPGERIVIMTPGGGGWGKVGEESRAKKERDPKHAWRGGSLFSRLQVQETN
ncbi:5-oxoprolinase [Xylona heveae TC161]|uniref:5-oxoprolinase n=1 Tax=Xylona heveae (strain CBS 132557 / TC161) TaxID=1328760 RepID=A0A165A9I1_XYLHT|nr:5-oxoprolinase [Xylona heveae TC161]KZF20131.1 5-oxoprolinase [Xylona heveae TC161]